MRFMLQKDSCTGKVSGHDVVKRLVDLDDYFKETGKPFKTAFCATEEIRGLAGNGVEMSGMPICDMSAFVPVGDVVFVQEFMKRMGGPDGIPPFNVPSPLMDPVYSGRDVRDIRNAGEARRFLSGISEGGRFYAKDARVIKSPSNGVVEIVPDGEPESDGYLDGVRRLEREGAESFILGMQVSTMLPEILSEWRVFVHNGGIVGCENYIGDPVAFPSGVVLKAMADRLDEHRGSLEHDAFPATYSFDVAVTLEGTFVIEMHDFFSVGLYGFESVKYPYMLSHAWYSILRRYGVRYVAEM